MKIVINSDYGGYSLSPLAIKRFAEINGKSCYFFSKNYENGLDGDYYEISLKKASKSLFFTAFSVKNPNDYLNKFDKKSRHLKTTQEIIEENKVWDQIYLNMYMFSDDRTNPLLIQIVEELGEEKAGGSCANLKIIEIPDNMEYEIEEYDGKEWVSEKHNRWS